MACPTLSGIYASRRELHLPAGAARLAAGIGAQILTIDLKTGAAQKVANLFVPSIGGSGFVGNSLYAFKIDEGLVGGTLGPQILELQLANGSAQKVASVNVPSIFGAVSFGEEDHGCRAGR